jgi:hypothetical protein
MGQRSTSASQPPTPTVQVQPPGSYTVKDFSGTAWRDFREENVYFMMTDRFADGNTANNNLWGDEYLPGGESQKYVIR